MIYATFQWLVPLIIALLQVLDVFIFTGGLRKTVCGPSQDESLTEREEKEGSSFPPALFSLAHQKEGPLHPPSFHPVTAHDGIASAMATRDSFTISTGEDMVIKIATRLRECA